LWVLPVCLLALLMGADDSTSSSSSSSSSRLSLFKIQQVWPPEKSRFGGDSGLWSPKFWEFWWLMTWGRPNT